VQQQIGSCTQAAATAAAAAAAAISRPRQLLGQQISRQSADDEGAAAVLGTRDQTDATRTPGRSFPARGTNVLLDRALVLRLLLRGGWVVVAKALDEGNVPARHNPQRQPLPHGGGVCYWSSMPPNENASVSCTWLPKSVAQACMCTCICMCSRPSTRQQPQRVFRGRDYRQQQQCTAKRRASHVRCPALGSGHPSPDVNMTTRSQIKISTTRNDNSTRTRLSVPLALPACCARRPRTSPGRSA
jgi:hypothetical protein